MLMDYMYRAGTDTALPDVQYKKSEYKCHSLLKEELLSKQ
jgi:hypothetical protein